MCQVLICLIFQIFWQHILFVEKFDNPGQIWYSVLLSSYRVLLR